jgi:coenzyme F420-0:L-glutamate ligase / coenzyme F420-1:gamma-L-glutamate ligase
MTADGTGRALLVLPVTGLPEVAAGDDLAALLQAALTAQGDALHEGDVVVVASKVVSKSLGLWADSADRAAVVASQTERVVAERSAGERVTRIVESAAGPVMAAAGVDASNTGGRAALLLLPRDPDAEAARVRARLLASTGLSRVAVVLSDTAGRPWRVGQTDFALGAAGLVVVDDLRGGVDADGLPLAVTARAIADELASAADLVKGKADAVPAAIVRGTSWATAQEGAGAASLVRTGREDWFDYGRVEAIRAALGIEPGSPRAEQVGIPSVAPESVQTRIRRAVAVACGELPFASDADTSGPGIIEVAADTAYQVGVVAARLQVALWGEGLDARLDREVSVGATRGVSVRVTVTER